MRSRAAPAKVVVVQSGQIVMNQTERVNAFQGRSRRPRQLAIAADELAASNDQPWPDALPGGQDGVSNGFHKICRCGRTRHIPVQVCVEFPSKGSKIVRRLKNFL
jgi:hypothetical protein